MIWRRWECFLTVGKELNYSKASKKLFLNQSVISYHIQNLEKELGIKLFERNSHTVSFTPSGKELYQRIAPVFAQLTGIIDEFNQNTKEYALRISSTYMLNYKIFAPIFEEFTQTHKNIKILPQQLRQDAAFTALLSEDIEALFAFEEEASAYPEIEFLPLFSIRRNGILVPASDSLAGHGEITYSHLRNHTVIFPKNIDENPRLLYFRNRILQMASYLKIIYAPDMLSAYAMVAEGKGICPAMDFLPSSSPNVVLLYNKEDTLSTSGICINRNHKSPYINEFVTLLAKKYPR